MKRRRLADHVHLLDTKPIAILDATGMLPVVDAQHSLANHALTRLTKRLQVVPPSITPLQLLKLSASSVKLLAHSDYWDDEPAQAVISAMIGCAYRLPFVKIENNDKAPASAIAVPALSPRFVDAVKKRYSENRYVRLSYHTRVQFWNLYLDVFDEMMASLIKMAVAKPLPSLDVLNTTVSQMGLAHACSTSPTLGQRVSDTLRYAMTETFGDIQIVRLTRVIINNFTFEVKSSLQAMNDWFFRSPKSVLLQSMTAIDPTLQNESNDMVAVWISPFARRCLNELRLCKSQDATPHLRMFFMERWRWRLCLFRAMMGITTSTITETSPGLRYNSSLPNSNSNGRNQIIIFFKWGMQKGNINGYQMEV